MKEDHSFLFLKIFFFFLKKFGNLEFFKELKILIDSFFFLKNLEVLNFFKELKILIDFFFFFESNLRSMSPMPLVPRPFLKISFFFFFSFLFLERFRKN